MTAPADPRKLAPETENQRRAREILRERLAQLHQLLEREREARESAEQERDSLRLRLNAEEHARKKDNEFLIHGREAAEKALRFYADRTNWTQMTSWGGRIHDDESRAIADGGKLARSVLPSSTQAGEHQAKETP